MGRLHHLDGGEVGSANDCPSKCGVGLTVRAELQTDGLARSILCTSTRALVQSSIPEHLKRLSPYWTSSLASRRANLCWSTSDRQRSASKALAATLHLLQLTKDQHQRPRKFSLGAFIETARTIWTCRYTALSCRRGASQSACPHTCKAARTAFRFETGKRRTAQFA